MGRPKKTIPSAVTPPPPVEFIRVPEVELPNGRVITSGETIKIIGEYGMTFKFLSYTTNAKTGVSWVECQEIHRGQIGAFRAFYIDRVKKIPVRRRRVKRNTSD